MADFDYGNARLRAMKSRLLPRQTLEMMASSESVPGLIGILTKTAYQKALTIALTRVSGKACVLEALHQDMIKILSKISDFYTGNAKDMVDIIMRFYDIENVKTLLRASDKQTPPQEVNASFLPVGELKINILTELLSAPDPRGVIDLLASMGFSIAQPLLKLRAESPGASVTQMELSLDQWHIREAYLFCQKTASADQLLLPAIQLEADLVNLMTVLRFVRTPKEHQHLRQLFDSSLTDLFVDPGKLPLRMLVEAGKEETVRTAVRFFVGTAYETPLSIALDSYPQSMRLSEFEKQLRLHHLRWMSEKISSDPLGIGVVLGYLALKINEIRNLRWILEGIDLGLKPGEILVDLEQV